MAVTVKFVNGLKEIGGTFVEVETDRAKCMFDFGYAKGGFLVTIPLPRIRKICNFRFHHMSHTE